MRRTFFFRCAAPSAIALAFLVGCAGNGNKYSDLLSFDAFPARQKGTPFTASQAVEVQFALAQTLEETDDLHGAATVYEAIVANNPKEARVVHRLAILYDLQLNFEKSQDRFLQCLALQPDNPDVYCDFGYSLYLQRRWNEAESSLALAIELDPKHVRAHNHLGLVLAQTGRIDEAISEFLKADCSTAEAHMNAGMALAMIGLLEEAYEQYEFAFSADPSSREVRSRFQNLDHIFADLQPPAGHVHLTAR